MQGGTDKEQAMMCVMNEVSKRIDSICSQGKGQYKLDREMFWSRLESTIETYVDRNPDAGAIQFIEEIIPFINEEVVMDVEELYNQIKQDAAI